MPVRRLRRSVLGVLALVAVIAGCAGAWAFLSFKPVAITLGPATTLYFTDDPPLRVRVHEAIHRRQMRDKSGPGRIWSALRYNFDYGYRLDEEAEAKAGELCLQLHRFSPELSAYTAARSLSQARSYRAWAWERMGMDVPDRVGETLAEGQNCHRILRDIDLDLPAGIDLSEEDELRLATLRYLQWSGPEDPVVDAWKARLRLAAYLEPARWNLPEDVPRFEIVPAARALALPPDTLVTALEAGEALHRLTYYMADRMYAMLRAPLPGYRKRALIAEGDAERFVDLELEDWPGEILERGLAGELDEGAERWLEAMSAHPLHRDIEAFALAPAADIVGARYRFDDRWEALAPGEPEAVKEAFLAQWGRAALAAQRGDTARADSILRLVVSGTLQWADHAPFEVEVATALDLLEAALGDLAELEERRAGEEPAWAEAPGSDRDWLRGARMALFSEDMDSIYRAMPMIALDPGIPHAFKQAAYRRIVLTDVCLARREDPRSQASHHRWRAAVEMGLVRRPSDKQVLELARSGVRELMETADIAAHQICFPGTGIHPDARIAIINALPGSAVRGRYAEEQQDGLDR